MSVFLFGSAAEEVFGVLIVIFCANAITGGDFRSSSLKVLFVSIQHMLHQGCYTCRVTGNTLSAHKNFQSIRVRSLIALTNWCLIDLPVALQWEAWRIVSHRCLEWVGRSDGVGALKSRCSEYVSIESRRREKTRLRLFEIADWKY